MFVAGTDDLPTLDSSTSQGDTPDARPVVATAGRVDPRGATKLAGRNNQCRFEAASLIQIVDQGRERLGQESAVASGRSRPSCSNGDDPWQSQVTRLKTVSNMLTVTSRTPASTSPRKQTALSEGRAAICVTNFRALIVRSNALRRGSSQERVGRPRQGQTTARISSHRLVDEAPSEI